MVLEVPPRGTSLTDLPSAATLLFQTDVGLQVAKPVVQKNGPRTDGARSAPQGTSRTDPPSEATGFFKTNAGSQVARQGCPKKWFSNRWCPKCPPRHFPYRPSLCSNDFVQNRCRLPGRQAGGPKKRFPARWCPKCPPRPFPNRPPFRGTRFVPNRCLPRWAHIGPKARPGSAPTTPKSHTQRRIKCLAPETLIIITFSIWGWRIKSGGGGLNPDLIRHPRHPPGPPKAPFSRPCIGTAPAPLPAPGWPARAPKNRSRADRAKLHPEGAPAPAPSLKRPVRSKSMPACKAWAGGSGKKSSRTDGVGNRPRGISLTGTPFEATSLLKTLAGSPVIRLVAR